MDHEERNISLVGKSGNEYYGKVCTRKASATSLSGQVVVCLSNSRWEDNHWTHSVSAIYKDDALSALEHFAGRDDITHLILIPTDEEQYRKIDIVDDLTRQYVHR